MSDLDAVRPHPELPLEAAVPDDRREIGPDDRVVLLIDNDESFARFLLDVAHDHGFRGLVATTGVEGIALAHQFRVDAITLDILLPVIDGWRIFDRLKSDLATRHVPVAIVTTEEDGPARGMPLGATRVLNKPLASREPLDDLFATFRGFLENPVRKLLVVAPHASPASNVLGFGTDGPVRTVAVTSGLEALGALDEQHFDCVLVEPVPGDFESLETTAEIVRQCGPRGIPAVLYSTRPLPEEKQEEIARISQGMTVRTVHSLERALDHVALYLHVPVGDLPADRREVLETLYSSDAVLAGKRVLLVDDDIRNIFAMTSVLERQNMQVLSAETGKEAIEKLDRSDVDIVLMDVMMPDMDGYDTMREIRKKERFRALPIIAVTAKAMKGDREKTLQAGAWDYLAKPVDPEQMLSVLRSWLHR